MRRGQIDYGELREPWRLPIGNITKVCRLTHQTWVNFVNSFYANLDQKAKKYDMEFKCVEEEGRAAMLVEVMAKRVKGKVIRHTLALLMAKTVTPKRSATAPVVPTAITPP